MGTWFNPHRKFDFLLCRQKYIYALARSFGFFAIGLLFFFFTAPGACQLYTRYPIVARALGLAAAFRPSASREQRYLAYKLASASMEIQKLGKIKWKRTSEKGRGLRNLDKPRLGQV